MYMYKNTKQEGEEQRGVVWGEERRGGVWGEEGRGLGERSEGEVSGGEEGRVSNLVSK